MTDSLAIEVLKQGAGPQAAKAGDTVTVHYVGTLTDGKKFDSSRDRGEGFTFKLGAGKVIKGWDQGVAGLKVGDVVKLTIPPDLAYGARGFPPVIPPNSTLVFEVELLAIR
jgi:FKBP-type peptidyl-prolyl cis-trans isomerase